MPAPAPLNEQFSDSYGMRGITSSNPVWNVQTANDNFRQEKAANDNNRSFGVRNAKVTGRIAKKAGGVAMQVSGTTMRYAGKATRAAGRGATQAGARLSATGIGAVVGVPLIAVGGAAQGAGFGMEAGGRLINRAGKRAGQTKKMKLPKSKMMGNSLHVRALFMVSSLIPIMFMFWFLMIGFWALDTAVSEVGGAITKVGEDIADSENLLAQGIEAVWKFGESIFTAVNDAINHVFNIDIGKIVGDFLTSAAHAGGYVAGLFYMLNWILGLISLIFTWAIYQFSGSDPLGGNGKTAKVCALLAAICLYGMPFLQVIPWFVVWILVIKKYDR